MSPPLIFILFGVLVLWLCVVALFWEEVHPHLALAAFHHHACPEAIDVILALSNGHLRFQGDVLEEAPD
jgi:hypothetical protein